MIRRCYIRAMRERSRVPAASEAYVQALASSTATASPDETLARIDELAALNTTIYDECVQLNPAANVMNPRAKRHSPPGSEVDRHWGTRVTSTRWASKRSSRSRSSRRSWRARSSAADFAEVRVGSGALANLYTFMACCEPGDSIIVPPASIGGHVTHNRAGAAGLYRLDIHEAPIDAERYTVDVDARPCAGAPSATETDHDRLQLEPAAPSGRRAASGRRRGRRECCCSTQRTSRV